MSDSILKQDNQSTKGQWGGPRPGAGRPKGSTTRPQIRGFYTEEEIEQFVLQLKADAETSEKVKLFLAEQIFGKAQQSLDVETTEKRLLIIDDGETEDQ